MTHDSHMTGMGGDISVRETCDSHVGYMPLMQSHVLTQGASIPKPGSAKGIVVS